jgi:hypothetical protein
MLPETVRKYVVIVVVAVVRRRTRDQAGLDDLYSK